MSAVSQMLRLQIEEAQQQALNRLLEAWDKELQAAAELFAEQKRKKQIADADQALESAAAERHLAGLVAQAVAGADISISIPSGVRVATDLVSAAVDADLSALLLRSLGDADLPQDQRSVAWAMGHGMIPHPGDLASIMDRRGLDGSWAAHLHELGQKLDAMGPKPLPQVQLVKLDALHGVVGTLKAYPADRLLGLAVMPEAISATSAKPAKEQLLSPRRVPPVVLAKALDALLAR